VKCRNSAIISIAFLLGCCEIYSVSQIKEGDAGELLPSASIASFFGQIGKKLKSIGFSFLFLTKDNKIFF